MRGVSVCARARARRIVPISGFHCEEVLNVSVTSTVAEGLLLGFLELVDFPLEMAWLLLLLIVGFLVCEVATDEMAELDDVLLFLLSVPLVATDGTVLISFLFLSIPNRSQLKTTNEVFNSACS